MCIHMHFIYRNLVAWHVFESNKYLIEIWLVIAIDKSTVVQRLQQFPPLPTLPNRPGHSMPRARLESPLESRSRVLIRIKSISTRHSDAEHHLRPLMSSLTWLRPTRWLNRSLAYENERSNHRVEYGVDSATRRGLRRTATKRPFFLVVLLFPRERKEQDVNITDITGYCCCWWWYTSSRSTLDALMGTGGKLTAWMRLLRRSADIASHRLTYCDYDDDVTHI